MLSFAEKPINTGDGRWFTVRIMPYRTLDDRIDGVVITFADITVAKTLEAQLREKHTALEKHVAWQSKKLVTRRNQEPSDAIVQRTKDRKLRRSCKP